VISNNSSSILYMIVPILPASNSIDRGRCVPLEGPTSMATGKQICNDVRHLEEKAKRKTKWKFSNDAIDQPFNMCHHFTKHTDERRDPLPFYPDAYRRLYTSSCPTFSWCEACQGRGMACSNCIWCLLEGDTIVYGILTLSDIWNETTYKLEGAETLYSVITVIDVVVGGVLKALHDRISEEDKTIYSDIPGQECDRICAII